MELTGKLKRGKNRFKIEVTNCWRNRLIGDAGLLGHLCTTHTNVSLVANRSQYKNAFQAYAADDPLAPARLAGPVVLEFGYKKKVLL